MVSESWAAKGWVERREESEVLHQNPVWGGIIKLSSHIPAAVKRGLSSTLHTHILSLFLIETALSYKQGNINIYFF
jgi:hypothetical protein